MGEDERNDLIEQIDDTILKLQSIKEHLEDDEDLDDTEEMFLMEHGID